MANGNISETTVETTTRLRNGVSVGGVEYGVGGLGDFLGVWRRS
jgi:hypothetical protein